MNLALYALGLAALLANHRVDGLSLRKLPWGLPTFPLEPSPPSQQDPIRPNNRPSPTPPPAALYETLPGWATDVALYSAVRSPCNVPDFVAALPHGYGYFADPGVTGGWCRSIAPANLNGVLGAHASGRWTTHDSGKTHLPLHWLKDEKVSYTRGAGKPLKHHGCKTHYKDVGLTCTRVTLPKTDTYAPDVAKKCTPGVAKKCLAQTCINLGTKCVGLGKQCVLGVCVDLGQKCVDLGKQCTPGLCTPAIPSVCIPHLQGCKKDYVNVGVFCTRTWGGSADTYAKSTYCSSGLEEEGLLCYEKCKTGYHGVGPVCWINQ